MKKKLKRFFELSRRADEGFTLVELIVVIAILAILAGVAVPAYNGYIKKANEAADEVLLKELNTAFAAACAVNGENHIGRTGMANIELADGEIPDSYVFANDVIDASFDTFYEGGEFKVFEKLIYHKGTGLFGLEGDVISVDLPGGGKLYITQEQLELIQSSTYSEDIGGLMYQIDMVAGLVDGLLGDGEVNNEQAAAIMQALVGSEDYMKKMVKLLGGDADATDIMTELGGLQQQLAQDEVKRRLAEEYGLTAEQLEHFDDIDFEYRDEADRLEGEVLGEMRKSMIVLSVAQSASNQSAGSVMDIINAQNPKKELLAAMGVGGTADNVGDGMGSAALVYGAFTAYANSASGTAAAKDAIANEGDPTAVFDILENPDELAKFQAYMGSDAGKNDLDACFAAMDVINNTSSDKDAVSGVLVNGYANDAFIGMLEGLLGTGTSD